MKQKIKQFLLFRPPLQRKLTLAECRLARYLHAQLKEDGQLEGLPDGIPAITGDLMPGNMAHDEWKRDVMQYQYAGKLFSTSAAQIHSNCNIINRRHSSLVLF